jgi:hypothetical protein
MAPAVAAAAAAVRIEPETLVASVTVAALAPCVLLVSAVYIRTEFNLHPSTAILSEMYRISSELRSQATAGPVSTTVGDHVGIRGAVGSLFCFCRFALVSWCLLFV